MLVFSTGVICYLLKYLPSHTILLTFHIILLIIVIKYVAFSGSIKVS